MNKLNRTFLNQTKPHIFFNWGMWYCVNKDKASGGHLTIKDAFNSWKNKGKYYV